MKHSQFHLYAYFVVVILVTVPTVHNLVDLIVYDHTQADQDRRVDIRARGERGII